MFHLVFIYRVFLSLCMKSKYEKCIWWMPWQLEAMKDVVRCEKLRLGANTR